MGQASHQYVIALGGNIHVTKIGSPRKVLGAAMAALAKQGLTILDAARIIDSKPLGPSARRYANSAALVQTSHAPPELLEVLKAVERDFGRERRGQRWASRVLDLDIVLWNGGIWASRELAIPHPSFRERDFVLAPAAGIAPDWRDPITGLSLRQLHARLTKPRTIPR